MTTVTYTTRQTKEERIEKKIKQKKTKVNALVQNTPNIKNNIDKDSDC